jgi:putative ABC transport system permease protein
MLKLTIKSLFARKLRLALTSIAIVLGVSFIVSSFVIADSLRSTFDDLAEDIQGNLDLTVRTRQEFGAENDRPPVPEDLLAEVQAVDGVKSAIGNVTLSGVVPIKPDGEPIESLGPPLLGINFDDDPDLGQLVVIEGEAPTGPDEFAMDKYAVDEEDLEVGQTYTVTSPATGNREFTLVGVFELGADDTDPLAILSAFETSVAQEFFGMEGEYTNIAVKVEDGVDRAAVAADMQQILPEGIEVVDATVTLEETQDDFGQISGTFGNVLLAFAIITLVVSAFLINNTFQIVIGQRVRELALLRALGATGKQVSRSVLFESLLVGAVSTLIGIGVGVLLSFGLRAFFSALGFGLPDGPLIIAPRTVIVAVVVGVGVTLIASLAPARKTKRVPPIAALRDDYQLAGTSLTRRLTIGVVVTIIGVLLMAWGLFGDLETAPLLFAISAGALAVFVGVNLLSPLVARPVARALGLPIKRAYGTTGRLSQENAARNPRRTASTASALMIGLALVSMAAVVGDSLKTTFLDILGNAVTADYLVQPESNDGSGGIPPTYSEELAALPEIETVVPYRFAFDGIRIDGSTKDLQATVFAEFPRHIDIDVQEGSLDGLTSSDILLYKDSAEDLGVEVGDELTVEFVDLQSETFNVAAIYGDASIMGNYLVDLETWRNHFANDTDGFVTATIAPGTDPAVADAAVDALGEKYPQVDAQTKAEFEEDLQSQLDSFLAVIQGFLAFALLIALLGIANTLALSVFERTRELGLLRAVGMTRRQIRRMVRWEAAIVAVFGGLLGVVLGILFGLAAATAMPESIINTISVPWTMIVIYVIVAGLAGLLAAFFPARRAGKLNVLDAISHD